MLDLLSDFQNFVVSSKYDGLHSGMSYSCLTTVVKGVSQGILLLLILLCNRGSSLLPWSVEGQMSVIVDMILVSAEF